MGYIYSIANAKRGFDVEIDSHKPVNVSLEDAILNKSIYKMLINNGFLKKDIAGQHVLHRLKNPEIEEKKITVVTYTKTDIFPFEEMVKQLLDGYGKPK